jgi:hypothetical protein
LQPSPEKGAAERIAGSGYMEQPSVPQRFVFETLLDVENGPGLSGFHDEPGPTARTRQVARLVETTDDIGRTERENRQLLAKDLEHSLVGYVLDPLDRAVAPLQIWADFRPAIFERSIEHGAANGPRRGTVPHLLDRAFLDITNRLGYPTLAAEKDITALPAAEYLEAGKGLRTKQSIRVVVKLGTPTQSRSNHSQRPIEKAPQHQLFLLIRADSRILTLRKLYTKSDLAQAEICQ